MQNQDIEVTKECPICIKKKDSFISCNYCSFGACKPCIKKYLLSSLSEPMCMSCKYIWNNDFLLDKFSKSFIQGKYKKHREKVVFEKEKSLLPTSIEDARIEKLNREMISEINIQNELLERIKHEYQIKKMEIENKKREIYEKYDRNIKDLESKEKKKFIKKCPVNNCNGYLSIRYKCELCDVYVCPDCHEVKNDGKEHKCNPNTIETIKQLHKDTKACPNCSSMIHKIDGCDQMFCVICKTAFSWKSGTIEKGRIHNPHYYQWIRDREDGDIKDDIKDRDNIEENRLGNCEENFISIKMTREIIWYHMQYEQPVEEINRIISIYIKIYRLIQHIQHDTLENQYNVSNDDIKKNNDLRVKFLLNDIDEDKWKTILYKREWKENRIKSFSEIFKMFISVSKELFMEVMNKLKNKKIYNDIIYTQLEIFDKLVNYTNDCLYNVAKKYNVKIPKIIQYELGFK